MVTPALVSALSNARRRIPHGDWQQVCDYLAAKGSVPNAETIRAATAHIVNRDASWMLSQTIREYSAVTGSEIAAAMIAIDSLQVDGAPGMEIIWTGPTNNRWPARRIDQVLYDLVCGAQRRIMLVTFAAHRVGHLSRHLADAVHRGVELTLIVESSADSEGQLTANAINAFKDVPRLNTRIFCWPLAQRDRNQAGRPGKLHAKCAVVDDVAVIGSANLTDDAFNRNMELGMLVRDSATVQAVVAHFEHLIETGVFAEIQCPT